MSKIASFVTDQSGSLREIHHVLWEIRYTVLLQLRHWKLRALDVWTVEDTDPHESAAEEAERQFARLNHEPGRFQG